MNGAEIWTHLNDTLEALKWPGVVAVAVFGFRKQIGDRIRSMRHYKGPAGEIDFNESVEAIELTANLKGDVENVIDASLTAKAAIVAEAEVVPGDDSTAEPAEHKPRPSLLDLRQDIENIIRASWSSGFDAGRSGHYTAAPTPDILWTGAAPRVVGLTADPDTRPRPTPTLEAARRQTEKLTRDMEAYNRGERAARLEGEIRRLRTQQGPFGTREWESTRKVLVELTAELQRLDPESPYANVKL